MLWDSNPEISVVAFVHAEAIGGVVNDARAISRLAHDHGALVAWTQWRPLRPHQVLIDEWGLMSWASDRQKALAGPSGVSLVAGGPIGRGRRSPLTPWLRDTRAFPCWIGRPRGSTPERAMVPVILAPLEYGLSTRHSRGCATRV